MPNPAAWVTVSRERITDAVNYIFWFSKSKHPKANNKNILNPYSNKMKNLIKNKSYNKNKRPGGQSISDVWAKNNGGAIPQNVIPYGKHLMIHILNTAKKKVLQNIIRFGPFILIFIKFLTDENDFVVDPF